MREGSSALTNEFSVDPYILVRCSPLPPKSFAFASCHVFPFYYDLTSLTIIVANTITYVLRVACQAQFYGQVSRFIQ